MKEPTTPTGKRVYDYGFETYADIHAIEAEAAAAERERLREAILGEHDRHECSPGFCADLILMAVDDELDPEDAP